MVRRGLRDDKGSSPDVVLAYKSIIVRVALQVRVLL